MLPTATEFRILSALIALGESHALKLLRHDDQIKRGSVYVTLTRLKKKGFVKTRLQENPHQSGPPRPLYTITGEGQKAIDAYKATALILADNGVIA